MKRIIIIGSGGAGKSTLARELGERLDIKIYHLDQIYWQTDWQPRSHTEFSSRQKAIIKKNEWVIDGNYTGTVELGLNAADTIIFLDLPTMTCLWQVFKRYLKYYRRTRPDMTPGNKERLTLEYLYYIFRYRNDRRPKVVQKISTLSKDKSVFTLKSTSQVQAFLEQQFPHSQ